MATIVGGERPSGQRQATACRAPSRDVAAVARTEEAATGIGLRHGSATSSHATRFANLYASVLSTEGADWAVAFVMDTPTMGRLASPFVMLSAALALLLGGCVVAPPHPHAPPPPPMQPPPAQTVYFYPELQQDEAKQDRDRYECYRWAVRETGVDPGMTPVRGLPPPPPPRAAVRDGAEVVAGAATGAIVGAAVSSPRNTGGGMVLGAIFGTMIGAAAHEARVQSAEQAYAQRVSAQQAAQQVPIDNFRRAMGACMTGRGYRVG